MRMHVCVRVCVRVCMCVCVDGVIFLRVSLVRRSIFESVCRHSDSTPNDLHTTAGNHHPSDSCGRESKRHRCIEGESFYRRN